MDPEEDNTAEVSPLQPAHAFAMIAEDADETVYSDAQAKIGDELSSNSETFREIGFENTTVPQSGDVDVSSSPQRHEVEPDWFVNVNSQLGLKNPRNSQILDSVDSDSALMAVPASLSNEHLWSLMEERKNITTDQFQNLGQCCQKAIEKIVDECMFISKQCSRILL
jgi:hypothetical protein